MTKLPRPALTLAEIRALSLSTTQHISAAREHIGAAGLEQTAALEHIITVSREQAALSQALAGLEGALQHDQPGQTARQHQALAELRLTGEKQLELAHQLGDVITAVLQNIMLIPVTQVSAAALTEIGAQVSTQLKVMEDFIKVAQVKSPPGHEAGLAQVETEFQAALEHSEQAEVSGQLHLLGEMGEDAAQRIAQVEGASVQRRVEALEQLADQAQEQADAIKRPS